MELTAHELVAVTGGVLVEGDATVTATSFAIDSRVLERGACFVALVADRDGHEFVADAFARGASITVVSREIPGAIVAGRAIVRVADPMRALAQLGSWARDQLHDATVVGITGSAGKTGTKDLTAAALAPKYHVHASPGSFNNEAGLPLTLLGASRATEALVLEMGARAVGDIAALCAIARPTIGVITNIGLAHAGPLGGRAGVALAKGELLEALPPDGRAVLDADDPSTPELVQRTPASVTLVSVGGNAADVRATAVTLDPELRPSFVLDSPWGSGRVRLALRGEHQVVNATLAAAVALSRGVAFDDVVAGLATVEPAPWRMQVERAPSGLLVLDDSYNANPSSMAAALRALARVDVPGPRIAVLGDMRELGNLSEQEHAAIGTLAAQLGIDVTVTVGSETGPLAASARAGGVDVIECVDAAGALDVVLDAVARTIGTADGDSPGAGADAAAVLVKGSRAVGLELVATGLRQAAE